MNSVLIINGPNMNMLGVREPGVYGSKTYEDLVILIGEKCKEKQIRYECFQSNHEGSIVDKIQDALGDFDGIVINPAAYTHTSIAILDALKAVNIPAVEVHISNPDEREDFRHISYAGMACVKSIKGHGLDGYLEAIDYLCDNY